MSNQLEIPEGYIQGDWSFYNSIDGHALCGGGKTIAIINYQKGEKGFPHEQSHKDAELIRRAPQMSDEIKRLREVEKDALSIRNALEDAKGEIEALQRENQTLRADLKRQITYTAGLAAIQSPTREDRAFQCLQGLLADSSNDGRVENLTADAIRYTDAMLAALAKPQTEQEPEKRMVRVVLDADAKEPYQVFDIPAKLPSGCEPFDLERAKKEGARDERGNIWKWNGGERENLGWRFGEQCEHPFTFMFNEQGIAIRADLGTEVCRLYCIAQRLPFDLAKALAGDKVVTRDGRPVTGFRKIHGVSGTAYFAYEASVPSLHSFTAEGRIVFAGEAAGDLFMEASV